MASVTLKDVPTDLHQALKLAAEAQGRSLNREILHRLKASVVQEAPPVSEVLARAREARKLFKGTVDQAALDRARQRGRA
ncbi:MAG: Arc family DNA-binding protein [Acidobacteria bacterium]|nr:Arc family DNA-binding protein [Acidobacteriota bacterium]